MVDKSVEELKAAAIEAIKANGGNFIGTILDLPAVAAYFAAMKPALPEAIKKEQDRAQRLLLDWGDEPCPHVHYVWPDRPKRACDVCWQAAKDELSGNRPEPGEKVMDSVAQAIEDAKREGRREANS